MSTNLCMSLLRALAKEKAPSGADGASSCCRTMALPTEDRLPDEAFGNWTGVRQRGRELLTQLRVLALQFLDLALEPNDLDLGQAQLLGEVTVVFARLKFVDMRLQIRAGRVLSIT